MSDHKKLLTTAEAANYLGLSASYLNQLRVLGVKGGKIESPPFIKIGRAVRYRRIELDEWVKNKPTYKTTSESTMGNKK
jgi:excisionase family DNA binding protein